MVHKPSDALQSAPARQTLRGAPWWLVPVTPKRLDRPRRRPEPSQCTSPAHSLSLLNHSTAEVSRVIPCLACSSCHSQFVFQAAAEALQVSRANRRQLFLHQPSLIGAFKSSGSEKVKQKKKPGCLQISLPYLGKSLASKEGRISADSSQQRSDLESAGSTKER